MLRERFADSQVVLQDQADLIVDLDVLDKPEVPGTSYLQVHDHAWEYHRGEKRDQ